MSNKTRRPLSLTLRITVMIGLVTSLIFLSFGWLIERSLTQHFTEQDMDELRVMAHAVEQSLRAGPNDSSSSLSKRLEKSVSGHHGVYFYVADAHGQTLHDSSGPDLAHIAQTVTPIARINIDSLHVWQEQNNSYRGAVIQRTIDNTKFTIVVAITMDFHVHYLQTLQHNLWITTLAACAISILAAWFAVHRGLAPLRQINRRINDISSNQLHLRLATEEVPHELIALTLAFNDMLGRIEDGFSRLSNFSADIAHELRTPITNLSTQTQVALTRARSVEEYREILYSSLEEYDRMAKMISDMLFLAQTDNKLLKPTLDKIDLNAELQALFDYFEAWAEERGVTLNQSGDDAICLGDRLMLRRALSNLLSNAIRHTPKGQAVNVRINTQQDTLQIDITNPGIEIPAAHLPKLFDRFYRVDASRQRKDDGAGLGLAIVRSIVEAHAGHISVTSNAQFTIFQIRLPQPD
jgi:two-component system, OmpR family, heavy metal sensor histidine kinase CusS